MVRSRTDLKETEIMTASFRKITLSTLAALTLATTLAATAAEARPRHRGMHWGVGAGIAALAVGGLIAAGSHAYAAPRLWLRARAPLRSGRARQPLWRGRRLPPGLLALLSRIVLKSAPALRSFRMAGRRLRSCLSGQAVSRRREREEQAAVRQLDEAKSAVERGCCRIDGIGNDGVGCNRRGIGLSDGVEQQKFADALPAKSEVAAEPAE